MHCNYIVKLMASLLPRETGSSTKNILTDAFIQYVDLTNKDDNLQEAISIVLDGLKSKNKNDTLNKIEDTLINHEYGDDKGAFNHILNKINKANGKLEDILQYLALFGDLSVLLQHLASYGFLENTNKRELITNIFKDFLYTLGECFSNIELDKELDDEEKQLYYNQLTVSYIRVADQMAIFKKKLEGFVGDVHKETTDIRNRYNDKQMKLKDEEERKTKNIFNFGIKADGYKQDVDTAKKELSELKQETEKIDGEYRTFLSSFTNNKDSGCYDVLQNRKHTSPSEHKDRVCLCILTVMMINDPKLNKLAEVLLLQVVMHYNEYFIVLNHSKLVVDTLINNKRMKLLKKEDQEKIMGLMKQNLTRDFNKDVVEKLIVYNSDIVCNQEIDNINNICKKEKEHNRIAKISAENLMERAILFQPTGAIVDDAEAVIKTTPVVDAKPFVEPTEEGNIPVAQPITNINDNVIDKLSPECKQEVINALNEKGPRLRSEGGNKSQKKRKMHKNKTNSNKKAKKTIKKNRHTRKPDSRRTHKKKLNHKKR